MNQKITVPVELVPSEVLTLRALAHVADRPFPSNADEARQQLSEGIREAIGLTARGVQGIPNAWENAATELDQLIGFFDECPGEPACLRFEMVAGSVEEKRAGACVPCKCAHTKPAPGIPLQIVLNRIELLRGPQDPSIHREDAQNHRADLVMAAYGEIMKFVERFRVRAKRGTDIQDEFYAGFCVSLADHFQAQGEKIVRQFLEEEERGDRA